MADEPKLETRVRERRQARGWTQDDLARRSGVSRSGIGAIETGRLVPSAAAALALASALECRVEDIFRLSNPAPAEPEWAWAPGRLPARYWLAAVGGKLLRFPVEPTLAGAIPHEGVFPGGGADRGPRPTCVLACCDPAAGLLAEALAASGVRLLALPRSSCEALELLRRGLVHAAGVHLAGADEPGGNAEAVRRRLGDGYRVARVASWEEGILVDPSRKVRTVESALKARLRWVGREPGSAARECLDALLPDNRPPRGIARTHRGVAEAIRSGWADAGIGLRLAAEEAALDFLAVREEAYDLVYPGRLADEVGPLLDAASSPGYRRWLGDLPGYRPAAVED
ncbi:MAG: substrate-binding domain-containing protein [Isosphaeraceae bacterium]